MYIFLWKKIWMCNLFFNFWILLLKMYLFEVATFFVALNFSIQLSFISSGSNVKRSLFLMKCIFFLSTVAIISSFPYQPLLRKQISSTHQYHSVYGYQTRLNGELHWLAATDKVAQLFDPWSRKITWQIFVRCSLS